MEDVELNVVALRYAWSIARKYPEDKDLQVIAEDLVRELVKYHYEDTDFLKEPPVERNKQDTVTNEKNEEELSKYDKIKRRLKETRSDKDFIEQGLITLFNQPDFSTSLDEMIEDKEKNPENWVDEDSYDDYWLEFQDEIKEEIKQEKLITKHGHALNVDKTVIVTPQYVKYDLRKDDQLKYEQSEKAYLDYFDKIQKYSNSVGLNSELLTLFTIDPDDIDQFNDIVFLTSWVDNRLGQMGEDAVALDNVKRRELINKYGTKYFSWTGVLSFRTENPFHWTYVFVGLLAYPYLPYLLYQVIRPSFTTYYYFLTFDLETGDAVVKIYNAFAQSDANDYINANIYDSLFQLKSSRAN